MFLLVGPFFEEGQEAEIFSIEVAPKSFTQNFSWFVCVEAV